MHVPFVDLTAQYQELAVEVHEAMRAVLERGDFILGNSLDAFEEEFGAYCEGKFAIGVSTGTAALELILRALNIGPGDEVIAPANTFIATALAIAFTGAVPVLVDVSPLTYNIDVDQIEAAISSRTRAIIPVHLYGQPADIDSILAIARPRGLAVIEDACQAHGARYKGRRVGALADAAAFSFYPSKNLGAYGDGGMVVTNDEQLAHAVRMLRNYGQSRKYVHQTKGYNHRLDTLQAAVLRVKLKRLDAWLAARRHHAARYCELLADLPITTPWEPEFAYSVYHIFAICVDQRDQLMSHLRAKGIDTGIHYPIPIHLQTAFSELGYAIGSFPVTESLASRILSLPMYPELSDHAVDYVAESIREFFR